MKVLLLTRDIGPLLFQCWASVVDGGSTLKQQLVSCFYRIITAQHILVIVVPFALAD